MKVAVGVMLLGALLAGSAYASDKSAAPSLSKAGSVSTDNKPLQSKVVEPSDKVGAIEADPKTKKQDSVTETPPESEDESVQLKGVRG